MLRSLRTLVDGLVVCSRACYLLYGPTCDLRRTKLNIACFEISLIINISISTGCKNQNLLNVDCHLAHDFVLSWKFIHRITQTHA
uniref:Secreted protein n=1 Tax=Romanomermis culicivorax TaxID=13658 RepID=A0A915JH32_ROMCU